jgi:hypothetical protein
MFRRLVIPLVTAITAAASVGFLMARNAFRSWGIDPQDATKLLPGDDLVPMAETMDTRSIELDAPPAKVWPWLLQMGFGRGGWYSYDQLDMSHPSLDHIDPTMQTLAVGDIVPTYPGGGFEVQVLEPDRALVLYADRASMAARAEQAKASEPESATGAAPSSGMPSEAAGNAGMPSDAMSSEGMPSNLKATGAAFDTAVPGDFSASWAFVLEPTNDGRTRLIERFRAAIDPPEGTKPVPPVARTMLGFGVFVMTRRQMLGIKDRVEGRPETGFLGGAVRRRSRRMGGLGRSAAAT